MNLFKKYGIQQIADVTFYSILKIDNEEFYIPVLFLDTLKVNTIDQKVTKVSSTGGYAGETLSSWNFGKSVTLTIEDALFSAASQSLMSGWLNSNISPYISILQKIMIANKYGELNYSIYAYPSPELTNEEWEIVFRIISQLNTNSKKSLFSNYNLNLNSVGYITKEFIQQSKVAEIRHTIKEYYKKRLLQQNVGSAAMPKILYDLIFNEITNVSDYYTIDSNNYKTNYIDRMEEFYVPEEGMIIDFKQQEDNLKRFFLNDKESNYIIYYDPKTMQPLVNSLSGEFNIDDNQYFLRGGTICYKWSRTIYRTISDSDILGRNLIIDTNSFPKNFKIVGETYIREQGTQKDSKYQFIINNAQLAPETSISLSAGGEPSTFKMSINVLPSADGKLIECKSFDVIEDIQNGGTKIVSQNYDYTRTYIDKEQDEVEDIIVWEQDI